MGTIARCLGNLRIWPGPILAVELVTTSRRARYFALRVLYAAALFFALWVTYENTIGHRWRSDGDMNSIAQFTAAFFGTFGIMQLMAVLLIGPVLAAGTIALERERRTMEYLYTTPLSNLEIVIGKLGGRVLQILYFVLSGVPVLALAMLMGGIAPRNIVSLTAITLSTVLFVTAVSLAVSAWAAKARDAVILAYLLFFCLWVLPLPAMAIRSFGSAYTWTAPVVDQFVVANPVMTFAMILEGRGPWGQVIEPWSLLVALVRNQMLAGGTALVLAVVLMRRVHLAQCGPTGPQAPLADAVFPRPDRRRSDVLEGIVCRARFLAAGRAGLRIAGADLRRGLRDHALFLLESREEFLFLPARRGNILRVRRHDDHPAGLLRFAALDRPRGRFDHFGKGAGLLGLADQYAAPGRADRQGQDPGQSLVAARLAPFLAVVWLPAVVLRPSYFWVSPSRS